MTDKHVKMDKLGDKSIKAGQRADLYNYNLDHVYCSDNSNYREQPTSMIQPPTAADLKMLRKENKQLQTMLLLHLDLIQEQSNQLIAKDKQLVQLREENERLRVKTERSAAIERQQKINKHGKLLNTSGGSPTIDSYFSSDAKPTQRTQNDSVLSNTKENFRTIRNTGAVGDAKQNANEPRNGEIHFQARTIKSEAIVMPKEHIKINKITATKERTNLLQSAAGAISADKCYSVKYQKMPANANFMANDKGKLINKIILQRKKSENGEKIFVRAKSVDVNVKRMDTDKWITVKSIKSENSGGRTDARKSNSGEPEAPLSTSLLLNNNGGKKADANVHFSSPSGADKCRKSGDTNMLPFNGHDAVASILNETVHTPAPTPTPPTSPSPLSASVAAPSSTPSPSAFHSPPAHPALDAVPTVKIEADDLDYAEYDGLADADDESKKSDSIMADVKEDLHDFAAASYPIKSPMSCVLSPSTSPLPHSPRPMVRSNIPSPIIGSTILYPGAKRIVPRNSYITTSKLYKTREWQLDEIEVETKQMITDEIHKEDEENEANLELPKWRTWEMSSNRDAPAPREWEDLSDDMFSKRHARFLQDERKRKKWDVQRIREQRTIERLKRRHCKDEINQQKDDELYSFFPSADQLRSIQISDDLPVSAFGELVPLLPAAEFVLPWHSGYGLQPSMLPDPVTIAATYLAEFKRHTSAAACHFDAAVTNVSSIVFLPKKRTGRSKLPVPITPNLIIPKHANIQ